MAITSDSANLFLYCCSRSLTTHVCKLLSPGRLLVCTAELSQSAAYCAQHHWYEKCIASRQHNKPHRKSNNLQQRFTLSAETCTTCCLPYYIHQQYCCVRLTCPGFHGHWQPFCLGICDNYVFDLLSPYYMGDVAYWSSVTVLTLSVATGFFACCHDQGTRIMFSSIAK